MTVKAKSQKPKRTLVAIRAEKAALIDKLESATAKIRGYCTGKIPRLASNGSHQDAVNFKDLVEKNIHCYVAPSLKKATAKVMQQRLDNLNGELTKFNYYFGE